MIAAQSGNLARVHRSSKYLLSFAMLGLLYTTLGWSEPAVAVNEGILEGMQFGPATNEAAFLGIPYAAPPVGDLRWRPPQPPVVWAGIRRATEFGAACPQLPANWLPYPAWSEDCLFLNVWTTHVSSDAGFPVLVFFHGGSNRAGYSQLTPLGPALSRKGLVVVSANYRLGPFGFLAHAGLTAESAHHASGDYGLLDQIQALQWVRKNIQRFGGDPNRITVMGQSSGAVDICLLMASPLAEGLFQQAILQSGDCQGTLNKDIRTAIPYNEISGTGEGAGEQLASALGVANAPDVIRKLRGFKAEAILQAWSNHRQIQFDAIVDRWVITEQPAKTFAKGRQLHVPILVGSNADEATVFGPGPADLDEYRKYLRDDTGSHADQEFDAWAAHSDHDVHAQYLKLQSDTFAYGALSLAQAMTQVGKPAYLYLLTRVEAGKRAALGAYHGEELAFLSDSFGKDWEHTDDEVAFGEAIRSYWVQFAKTGNPNLPGLPIWPAYDAKQKQRLELGSSIRIGASDPQLNVLAALMKFVLSER